MDPSTQPPKKKQPVRPDYLYLQPFDLELRNQIVSEAGHCKVSVSRYVQDIMQDLGVRGRADRYSNQSRTRAMRNATAAIKAAKKMPKKPPYFG